MGKTRFFETIRVDCSIFLNLVSHLKNQCFLSPIVHNALNSQPILMMRNACQNSFRSLRGVLPAHLFLKLPCVWLPFKIKFDCDCLKSFLCSVDWWKPLNLPTIHRNIKEHNTLLCIGLKKLTLRTELKVPEFLRIIFSLLSWFPQS